MRETRKFVVLTALALAAGSTLITGGVPAGAAKPPSGTVHCRHFQSSSDMADPATWSLSGCNLPKVTGRSGTPVQTGQTAEGTTLVIDWSTGKTTTLFLSSQTTPANPKPCHFKDLGPHESQTAYVQPGSVTADTTGFVNAGSFTVTICRQESNVDFGVTSTWNPKPFKF